MLPKLPYSERIQRKVCIGLLHTEGSARKNKGVVYWGGMKVQVQDVFKNQHFQCRNLPLYEAICSVCAQIWVMQKLAAPLWKSPE